MKNGLHKHNCSICHEDYTCQAVTHCGIEDRYAVCNKIECIKKWELEGSFE